MLCRYDYFPTVVKLTFCEMEKYSEYSKKIEKLARYVDSGEATEEEEENLSQLLKQRHRIIERAENKFQAFLNKIETELKRYKDKTIVFCPEGQDENGEDILEKYSAAVWKIAKENGVFLVKENYVQGTDKRILKDFARGDIDILFSKQRLNEGIDVPAACRAFFVSSSTSEREFIQRRGRVLRKAKGKLKAQIFDFIGVPEKSVFVSDKDYERIISSEMKRAMDFAQTADNFIEIKNTLAEFL